MKRMKAMSGLLISMQATTRGKKEIIYWSGWNMQGYVTFSDNSKIQVQDKVIFSSSSRMEIMISFSMSIMFQICIEIFWALGLTFREKL